MRLEGGWPISGVNCSEENNGGAQAKEAEESLDLCSLVFAQAHTTGVGAARLAELRQSGQQAGPCAGVRE